MNKLIEYTFYDGENITTIDRDKQFITMFERGGWSRSYTLTFQELTDNAARWDIHLDLHDSDELIAEIATNIILANNAVSHNLDPFVYLSKSDKITDPRDMNSLKKFEDLFDKYSHHQIIRAMSENTKQTLRDILAKED